MLRATFELRPAEAVGDGLAVLLGSRAYDCPGGLEAAVRHAVETL